jgi:hypothetical protein
MHESWPACGGSTSVGTTSDGEAGEKSRNRVSGVRRTIRWRVAHFGGRRSVMICHHRMPSTAMSSGVRASTMAPAQ